MWLSTTVNAFDVLGRVHVEAVVRVRWDHPEEDPTAVHRYSTTFDGTGEVSPERWLQDVLVALAETL